MNVLISGNNKKRDFFIYLKNVIKYLDKYTSWDIFLDEYIFIDNTYKEKNIKPLASINNVKKIFDLVI